MMAAPRKIDPPAPGLNPAQQKARRQRNVAIGLAIAALCMLFYLVTLAKMGASFFARSM